MRKLRILLLSILIASSARGAFAASNPWTYDPTNVAVSGGSISGADLSGARIAANNATVTRTMAAIAADRINVLSQGVDNSGATDTTVALNAALMVASSAGKAAYLPCGIYQIGHSVKLSIPANAIIVSDGAACTILRRSPGALVGPMVQGNSAGWSLLGVTLDGNRANETLIANNLDFSGASNFLADHVNVINSNNTGIYGAGDADSASTSSSITNFTISNCAARGFFLNGPAINLRLVNGSSSANGSDGFDFNNIFYPFSASYHASILNLVTENLTASNNGGNGFHYYGFVTAGATSAATAVNGNGNDPIYNATINNIHANNNASYGAMIQVDASHANNIFTSSNGSGGSGFAGVELIAENSIISNVDTYEPLTAWGVDSGGSWNSVFNNFHATGFLLNGLYTGASSYLTINNPRCENFGTITGGVCVKMAREDGSGSVTAGAQIMWNLSASHNQLYGAQCSLNNSKQICVLVQQNPPYITVDNSYSFDNFNDGGQAPASVFSFECTVGCEFNGDHTDDTNPESGQSATSSISLRDWMPPTYIASNTSNGAPINLYTRYIGQYLNSAYDVVLDSGGGNYGNPIITATGAVAALNPPLTPGVRPDTNAVVTTVMQTAGSGCSASSPPTCTISDSNGSGSGATCHFLVAPWAAINGRNAIIENMTQQVAQFQAGPHLFTPGAGNVYLASHGIARIHGSSGSGGPQWLVTGVQNDAVSPYAASSGPVAAAGTTQAAAAAVAATDNTVSSASNGSAAGVCLPDTSMPLRVRNATAIAITVYPCLASETINGGTAGAGVTEPAGTQQAYTLSGTNWMVSP